MASPVASPIMGGGKAQPIGAPPTFGGGMTTGASPINPIAMGLPTGGAQNAPSIPFSQPPANPIAMAGGMPMGSAPMDPVAMAGQNPAGISSGINTADGSYTMTGDFKDTYGAGTGTALAGVLGGLGSATDGAVLATNNAIRADAMKSQANIGSGLAAAGISADSSTNALAQGDFAAGLSQTIASTDASMQLNEENTLISALQGEGAKHGGDVSTWDSISGALSGGLIGMIGQGASGISEATGAGGTAGKILDGIGSLAMFA